MKIIVIGDTHIPKKAKEIPDIVKEECISADLIIHVGDWQTIEVYKYLTSLGDVEGVYGNVDCPELLNILPSKKIICINQKHIGIIHGHGHSKTTEKRVISAFEDEKIDCILFGHSHIPVHKYINNILLFNPGSATDKRKQKNWSYGIITITNEIVAKHVFF